jgi:hypothetical protein
MPNNNRHYSTAREQLISFLRAQGYKPHPNEVFCPDPEHCWVDVAALKGQDYWAFEYKSRVDSMRRGLDQCCSYANAFNYVVLVVDRNRVTTSPYFNKFRAHGFGVWQHDGTRFYSLIRPKRRAPLRNVKCVVERQFKSIRASTTEEKAVSLSKWLQPTRLTTLPGEQLLSNRPSTQ